LTRIFLLDDHEIIRRGIMELINREPDLEVVGEASGVRQALARVAATLPDVAVLDVQLPDGSGIDACRQIRSANPSIRCLMLTAFDDSEATSPPCLPAHPGMY
jgi:two-component system response regulator DevR